MDSGGLPIFAGRCAYCGGNLLRSEEWARLELTCLLCGRRAEDPEQLLRDEADRKRKRAALSEPIVYRGRGRPPSGSVRAGRGADSAASLPLGGADSQSA
jgi:hypothetical protein